MEFRYPRRTLGRTISHIGRFCAPVPITPCTDYAHHSPRQQTLPSSAPGEVKKLTARLLLPRSHLPLSFLDPIQVSTVVPTARLFSTHIRALEYERPGSPNQALAMVAELEPDGSLYAVERVQCGIYALCRLGGWVSMEDLEAAALTAGNFATPRLDKPLDVTEPRSWWDCAAISPFDADEGLQAKRSKANTSGIVQLRMRSSRSRTSPDSSQSWRGAVLPGPDAMMAARELPTSAIVSCEQECRFQLSIEELLDTVRCQYLEALYLSKVNSLIAIFMDSTVDKAHRPPWRTLLKDLCPGRVQSSRRSKRRQWRHQILRNFYVPVYSHSQSLTKSIGKPYRRLYNLFLEETSPMTRTIWVRTSARTRRSAWAKTGCTQGKTTTSENGGDLEN